MPPESDPPAATGRPRRQFHAPTTARPTSRCCITLACRALGLKHIRTRPYRPRTNGKAERFIRTMLAEWAYGAIYRDSNQRTAALAVWLDRYNTTRPHGALGHQLRSAAYAS